MTRLTADDTRALMQLQKHAAGASLAYQITAWPDGPVSVALHRPDALHSRAAAHGVGGSIGEAVRAALAEHKEPGASPPGAGRDGLAPTQA